jgi:NADP-dependent alcohol dehydrogenase
MKDFTYVNPTRIEFGKDKEQLIGQYMAESGIKHVLLTYGSERIKQTGLFDTVINSLSEHGITFVTLGGIVSNPVLSKVKEGVEIARANHVDAILSVGGGSVLDSAKAIAAGMFHEGDIWDLFTFAAPINKALPIYSIITLAATGSEMNSGAVVTNDATNQKFFISSPLLNPKVSVINPLLQQSVSQAYLVYAASDIIAHSIEAYFTASYQPELIAAYVEANIKAVIRTTNVLLTHPDDYEARGEFAWAATQALNGSTYIGLGTFGYPNHMIEHAMSALFNVPHGAGLSVVVIAWMKWYLPKNPTMFDRFAKVIFDKDTGSEGIAALEAWYNTIGTPTRLSQLHIGESDLQAIAENAYENAKFFGLSDTYSVETIRTILEKAR